MADQITLLVSIDGTRAQQGARVVIDALTKIEQAATSGKTGVDALNLAIRKLGTAKSSLAGMATEVNKLGSSFKQAGTSAVGALTAINRAMRTTRTTLSRLTMSVKNLAGIFIVFGAIRQLAEGLGSIKEFEYEMDKVGAISRAVGSEFDALEKKARQLGKTTVFTATEAASGLKMLSMAGFDVQESLASIDETMKMSIIGDMSLTRSTEVMANTIRGFGLEASQANEVVDIMAATITSSTQTAEEYTAAMRNIIAPAKTMGISLKEASAMIGILADNGLKGSRATASLRTQLLKLAKPTDEAKAVMKELKLSFYDNGEFVGVANAIERMENALRDYTPEARNMVLATLFGSRSFNQFAILLDSGAKKMREYTETVGESGVATEMYQRMTDNLYTDLKLMKSAFEDLMLTLGDSGLLAALRSSTQWMTEFLRGLTNVRVQLGFTSGSAEKMAYVVYQTVVPAWKGFVEIVKFAAGWISRFIEAVYKITPLSRAIDSVGLSFENLVSLMSQTSEQTKQIFANAWENIKSTAYLALTWIGAQASNIVLEMLKSLANKAAFFFSAMVKKYQAIAADTSFMDPIAKAQASVTAEYFNTIGKIAANAFNVLDEYAAPVRDEISSLNKEIGTNIDNLLNLSSELETASDWYGYAASMTKLLQGAMDGSISFFDVFNDRLDITSRLAIAAASAIRALKGAFDFLYGGGSEGGNKTLELPTKPRGGGGGGKRKEKTAADMIAELKQQLDGVNKVAQAWESGKDAARDMAAQAEMLNKLKKENIKATQDEINQIILLNQQIEKQNDNIKYQEEAYKILHKERDRLTLLNEAVAAVEETESPREKMNREFERANELLPSLVIYFQSLGFAEDIAAAKGQGVVDKLKEMAKGGETFQQTMSRVEDVFVNGFTNMIVQGESFRDTLRNIGKQLLQMAAQSIFKKIFGGIFSSMGFANGAAFSGGRTTAFATGGVVSSPTFFPMANGGTGLMGEAGPEAVMPLKRLSSGKLGVYASGGGGGTYNVTNNVNVRVDGSGENGDERLAMKIGKQVSGMIDARIHSFVQKQKRPGGSLYSKG